MMKFFRNMGAATLLVITGIVIVSAGIYFEINNLSSAGPTMGRHGITGTGELDGKGMIFCGLIIAGFALIIRQKDTD